MKTLKIIILFSSFAFASFGQNIKIKTIKNFYTKAQVDSLNAASGVISVNTRTGAVILTSDSIPEGTLNKYDKVSNLALGTATSTGVPITNSNGTGFTLGSATTTVAGLLRAADKIVIASLPDTLAKFIRQNGNTYGASVTLGTNDNNVLNFKTNNVVRGGITTSGNFFGLGFESSTAPTNGLFTLGSGGVPTTISRDLPDGVTTFNVNNINGLSTANILTLQSGGSNVFAVNKTGSVISGGTTFAGAYTTSATLAASTSSIGISTIGIDLNSSAVNGYGTSERKQLTVDTSGIVTSMSMMEDTVIIATVTTAETSTPTTIATIPIQFGYFYDVEVRINGRQNDGMEAAAKMNLVVLASNVGGTVVVDGSANTYNPIKSASIASEGIDVTAVSSGSNLLIQVAGSDNYTMLWKAHISIVKR